MDIRLPNMGEGAEAGTVASILVKAGDVVEKDQALIEIESEKAVISIPSHDSGQGIDNSCPEGRTKFGLAR